MCQGKARFKSKDRTFWPREAHEDVLVSIVEWTLTRPALMRFPPGIKEEEETKGGGRHIRERGYELKRTRRRGEVSEYEKEEVW